MASWTTEELASVVAADELELSADGRTVTIWVVRVGDDLYIRSWRGSGGDWYRRATRTHTARIRAGGVERDVALDEVDGAVDDAYRTKYARYLDSYTAHMVAPEARATTLRLGP